MTKALFSICLILFNILIASSTPIYAESLLNGTTISDDVVLQVVLDRFKDGNPNNNIPSGLRMRGIQAPDSFSKKIYDPQHKKIHHYYGGDLQGLMAAIPEIKSLGFSAIWISPHMLQASAIDHDGDHEVTAYHGYWIKDWFLLDPHLTSTGEDDDFKLFSDFVKLCHENDIKVIIDIVYNHSNPFRRRVVDEQGRVEKNGEFIADYSPQYITSSPFDNERRMSWFNPSLNQYALNAYCDSIGKHDDDTCEYSVTPLYGSLADFNPSYEPYLAYMKEATTYWIKYGIDGLRLDTFVDVPITTWNELLGAANEDFENNRKHGINKPLSDKLILMGEYWGAGPVKGRNYATNVVVNTRNQEARIVSLMDFALANEIVRIFGRRGGHHYSVDKLLQLASGDDYVDPKSGHNFGYGMTTFFDNHDRKLLIHYTWNEDNKYEGCSSLSGSSLKADKDGNGNLIDYKKAINQATIFLLSLRGMPIIYYSDLQHKQPPCYPFNKEGRCTRPMLDSADQLVINQELATALKKMTKLRRKNIEGDCNPDFNRAIIDGDFRKLRIEDKSFPNEFAKCYSRGSMRDHYNRSDLTYAFERCTKDQNSCIVVIGSLNFSADKQYGDRFNVYGMRIPIGQYQDILSGKRINVSNDDSGNIFSSVRLKNYETIVLSYKR